jgi:hypothetical protein
MLIAAVIVIPAEAVILPIAIDWRPSCVRADEWISQHYGELPTLYDDFIALPSSFRRRIFPELTDEAKAGLWKTQIERVMENDETLSPEQREFMDSLVPQLTPSFFRSHEGATALSEEIARLFPPREHHAIFRHLGPDNGRFASLEITRLLVAERVRRLLGVSASVANCYCDSHGGGILFGDCPRMLPACLTPDQVPPPYTCTYKPSGCGDLWRDPCDGMCCRSDGSVCA